MILLQLFWVFFRIGLFSFGGGYAMIPLLEAELITAKHWLTWPEMIDVVSISQMTPGPIAINMATYAGYKLGGVAGSAIATLGVVAPSIILVFAVFRLLSRFQDSPRVQAILRGIRPMVLALILVAILSVARMAPLDPAAYFIFGGALAAAFLARLHPILVLLAAGLAGVLLYT